MSEQYDIVSQNPLSTVVSHYQRDTPSHDTFYQSEKDLERDLIERLQRQGYEYLPIHQEAELVANLRRQIERLNGYQFTDGEWQRFFDTKIANKENSIEDKSFTIQRDPVKSFQLDSGEDRNITLIDQKNIHANFTQVIHQYEATDGLHANRYDVTILVNGLPLVHIELKRRGVRLREAFDQINRYGRESFWSGSALFEYVQIFVISNGTETKYYSNTTRQNHLKDQSKGKHGKPRTCNSFEFTSYWSDADNNILRDLEDFTATFLSRHTLLSVLTRFCVFTEQKTLMVMRPYQIAATERLLNRIDIVHHGHLYGTKDSGGYIWHSTGSGKTLTSFKAAQLAIDFPYINKVLFVVDRKDLDYQTMKEYDRFQKGAANGSKSTKELEAQIHSSKSKIVVTTIQKLSTYIKKYPQSDFYKKEVVFIFDECHRSQFGDMHQLIIRRFKKYYLFGFTGTPIFAENVSAGRGIYRTTEDVFGHRLHTYTLVDAIRDHNILPFRVDYVRTMKEKEDVEDSKVWDIEREKALEDPRRIHNVAQYILKHFDRQTRREKPYSISRIVNIPELARDRKNIVEELRAKTKVSGFNSIFAVQNIPCARLYYLELKRKIACLPENRRPKIATIFSYAPNEQDADEGDMEENNDNTNGLDANSREFLDGAIADYNAMFGTNYDTSADKFPNYYKDVSLRMKNREIDILIVVNMFLTGFDAPTLNTLWVDKNLRYHGLLQAFSRTNRILNSVKVFGNIVCFRNLEDATNRSLSLFGDPNAKGVTILRSFEDYFYGYSDDEGNHIKGYKDYLDELQSKWTAGSLPLGKEAEKDYIRLFGIILQMRNLLICFDPFPAADPLPERSLQDYTSIYLDLADKYRNQGHSKEDICDDVVFEMELVKQIEVDIDYILYLVQKFNKSHQKDVLVEIEKAIDSSPDLRDKKELIKRFIASLNPDSNVYQEWKQYVNDEKRKEFHRLISEEHLKEVPALKFIEDAFLRGYIPEGGKALDKIIPDLNPFDPSANRGGKIQQVLDRLKIFFNRFFRISDWHFS